MKTILFFAQTDMSNVPPEIFKWVAIILIGSVLLAAVVIATVLSFRKNTMAIDPQPVEVRKTPKRFNYELDSERHLKIGETLSAHDRRISSLEEETFGMEARILKDGQDRTEKLQEQINDLPDRIIATLVNAKKLSND